MRYIELTLIILSINLTVALFGQLDIMPDTMGNYTITSTESVNTATGEFNPANASLSYKMQSWMDDEISYIDPGVQDTTQQYLQAGGDFIRAWNIFWEIFVGTFIIYPTLRNFGVPPSISWYFSIPFVIMYVLALIQFLSGRQIEPEG